MTARAPGRNILRSDCAVAVIAAINVKAQAAIKRIRELRI
jgi:hypothetical protein